MWQKRKDEWDEVGCIRDDENNLVAVITEKKKGRDLCRFSYAIFREFTRGSTGAVIRSPYLNLRHVEPAVELQIKAAKFIRERKDVFYTKRRGESFRKTEVSA